MLCVTPQCLQCRVSAVIFGLIFLLQANKEGRKDSCESVSCSVVVITGNLKMMSLPVFINNKIMKVLFLNNIQFQLLTLTFHFPATVLFFFLIVLFVSNVITYNIHATLTPSLLCLGPPTHHRRDSTHPWELRATRLLPTGYASGCCAGLLSVCVCVCPALYLSLCLGCGDLYGVLVTPCVISISVMSISIA